MVTITLSSPTTEDEVLSTSNAKAAVIIDNFLTAVNENPAALSDQAKMEVFLRRIRIFVRDVADGVIVNGELDEAKASHVVTDWD